MTARITERSLYPPLDGYLKELGFNSASEIKDTEGQLDILAIKEEEKYIIEIKIGDPQEKIIQGLAQALKYAKDNNTNNVIVINYPDTIRTEDIENLNTKALTTITNTFSSTYYLTEAKDTSPKELFDELNRLILLKRKTDLVDVNLVIKAISESITAINSTLRRLNATDLNNLINMITGKLDLFMALSELKKEEEVQDMVLNLISYLLVNQMLFYHVFSKKSGRIPELKELDSLNSLKLQFKNITKIDYKSIYQIDVISKLPENINILHSLNDIIAIFKLVKPELVEHDLIGRLFHDLLPYETRKILAAFYTNPIAADILAGLCINTSEDKVIDPACGSGTLLVSAYKEKERLDEDNTEKSKLHHYFVEEEITGMDIMPFAAHLTAINLSSMNIETPTDNLNVGVMDTLSLSKHFKNKRIYEIKEFSRELQTTMDLFKKSDTQTSLTRYTSSQSVGAVTADSQGTGFKIRRNSFDSIIANPPFSDREKMPNDYLRVLDSYTSLNKICGSQVNLWGYFLALNEFLLKKNGTFGFVIPINIFRGRATQDIRDYLLDNYTIKYIVKTGKNIAFSENSALRDILFIAINKKPTPNSKLKFIIINEDLHELTLIDANNISRYIKNELITIDKELDIIEYKQSDLQANRENLMPYFGLMRAKSGKVLSEFKFHIENKLKNKLRKFNENEISEGFHASPAGVSQMTFITNNYGKNRTSRAFFIYDHEDNDNIYAKIKGLEGEIFEIPKSSIKPAFRTLTDVHTFNIDNKMDFFIEDTFPKFDMVLQLSKFNTDKHTFSYESIRDSISSRWTYMVVGRRFNPHSPNTSLFAFSSNTPFISPHTFKTLHLDSNDAKINTLYLNSVLGIFNIILLKEQTTGNLTDIMQKDLMLLDILDINKLDNNTIDDLLYLYDELKDEKFKSLSEQFSKQTKNRVKLDTQLLSILGFDKSEIEQILPEVYEAISYELING